MKKKSVKELLRREAKGLCRRVIETQGYIGNGPQGTAKKPPAVERVSRRIRKIEKEDRLEE